MQFQRLTKSCKVKYDLPDERKGWDFWWTFFVVFSYIFVCLVFYFIIYWWQTSRFYNAINFYSIKNRCWLWILYCNKCLLSPLYKAKIETICFKSFFVSVPLKSLYLKYICKLKESLLFLNTWFLDYRGY